MVVSTLLVDMNVGEWGLWWTCPGCTLPSLWPLRKVPASLCLWMQDGVQHRVRCPPGDLQKKKWSAGDLSYFLFLGWEKVQLVPGCWIKKQTKWSNPFYSFSLLLQLTLLHVIYSLIISPPFCHFSLGQLFAHGWSCKNTTCAWARHS